MILIKPQIDSGRGFFSIFNFVVDVMTNMDQHGHSEFFVDLSNFRDYIHIDSGRNPWDYVFAPMDLKTVYANQYTLIRNINDFNLSETLDFTKQDMSQEKRIKFSKAIEKYVRLNDGMQKLVDDYVRDCFVGRVLAVHRRETDMGMHGPIMPLEKFFEFVDAEAPSFDRIFVSTDSASNMQAFRERYGNKILGFGKIMVDGNQPIFRTKGINKKDHLVELIANVWLMARCHKILRTNSNISMFVTALNPDMNVHNLQTGFRY